MQLQLPLRGFGVIPDMLDEEDHEMVITKVTNGEEETRKIRSRITSLGDW